MGTTTVGSVPITPAGESQDVGIGAMVPLCELTGWVVDTTVAVVDVDEVDGAGGPRV